MNADMLVPGYKVLHSQIVLQKNYVVWTISHKNYKTTKYCQFQIIQTKGIVVKRAAVFNIVEEGEYILYYLL